MHLILSEIMNRNLAKKEYLKIQFNPSSYCYIKLAAPDVIKSYMTHKPLFQSALCRILGK